jgi:hypothetical protein
MLTRACLSLAVAFLACASSASAASRPTVSAVGLSEGVVATQKLPYIELGALAELSVGYAGHLAAGEKLQLLEKDPGKGYKALKTALRLSGGHAKVHVSFNNLGGPVLYKVALLSGHRRLAVSKALTIYWTPLPGGVFAELAGDYASYTSRTNPSESCAAPTAASTLCKGDASSGESNRVTATSGTYPVPPGWSIALTFNGQPVCSSSEIDAHCEGTVTFPTVTATTIIPLTATMTSPHGQTIVATRLITVYP